MNAWTPARIDAPSAAQAALDERFMRHALALSRRIHDAYRDDAIVQAYVAGRNVRASFLAVEPDAGMDRLGVFYVDSGGDFQTMADSLALSLRLAAPLVLAAMLGNFALGLLARVAPQMQVFIIAAPAQIMGGLLLLGLLLPVMLSVWLAAAGDGLLLSGAG